MDKKRKVALVMCILAFFMLIAAFITQLNKQIEKQTGYYISTAEDLIELSGAVNDGSTHLGVTVKQTADIDMSGVEDWTPIGAGDDYFYGTYDGCGYTIYGLTCKQSSSYEDNALFGTLAGKIINLRMEGFNISGRYASAFAVASADEEEVGIINCTAVNGLLNGERCGVFADDFSYGELACNVAYGVSAEGATLYACSYNAAQLYCCFADCNIVNDSSFSGKYNTAAFGGVKDESFFSSSAAVDELSEAQAIACLNGAAAYSDLMEYKAGSDGIEYGDRCLSALSIVMTGSGKESDPYLISSYKDLMVFCTGVNLGRSFAGYFLRQTRDFDLSVVNSWTPVGQGKKVFYGTYDGAGYKFIGIHCERTKEYKNNGFFGALGGTVKNMSLVGGEIYGDCVGGIASFASTIDAAIYNCYSSVALYGNFRSGGIADNFIGTIENCVYIGENPKVYLVSYYAEVLSNSYTNCRLVRSNFSGQIENCHIIGEDVTLAEAATALNANISSTETNRKYAGYLLSWTTEGEELKLDISSAAYPSPGISSTLLMIAGIFVIIAMALILYYILVHKKGLSFKDEMDRTDGGETERR